MLIQDVARICHEANRALQIVLADDTIPVSPNWDDLDQETKDSAMNGVFAHIKEDISPEQSHENWMQFKIGTGWTFGPVKDEVKKEHPLLVPYSELSQTDKLKDKLFRAIVTTVVASALEERV